MALQHKAFRGQHPAHGGRRGVHQIESGPARGELAVRAVDGTPVLEQAQDRGPLVLEQPVHRAAAGGQVDQPVLTAASPPVAVAVRIQPEQPARPSRRPAPRERVLDQVEQPCLHRRIDPSRDRAGGQSQRAFPSCRCNATACSVTVARNRSISIWAASNAACSRDTPGRPGTAAASASNAP